MKKYLVLILIGISSSLSCTLPSDCTSGDSKCEPNADDVGVYFICQDGLWIEQSKCKDNASCQEYNDSESNAVKTKCGECTNSHSVCVNNDESQIGINYECKEGVWTIQDNCSNDASCQYQGSKNERGQCKNGDVKCENDPQGYGKHYQCSNGIWIEHECGQNSCSNNSCGTCLNGSIICENDQSIGQYITCQNGIWEEPKPCDDNHSCRTDNDNSICGECRNGETTCMKNALYKCELGSWVLKKICTCKPDGSECSECEAGVAQCVTVNTYKTCLSTNEWDTEIQCDHPKTCVFNSEKQSAKCDINCEDGDTFCTENTLFTCQSKQYTETNCQFGCNENTGKCNACQSGTSRCEDGKISVCNNNNEWQEPRECDMGICFDETECTSCTKDTSSCKNDSSGIGLQTKCTDGKNKETIQCDGTSCDGSECGTCLNNAVQCSDGKLQTCRDGKWTSTKTCYNNHCQTSTACDECKNGTVCYQNKKEVECTDGKYVETGNTGTALWVANQCSFLEMELIEHEQIPIDDEYPVAPVYP